MSAWVWICALGVGTLAIRASFLVPRGRGEAPLLLARVLRLVPAAVLSALVTPALFYADGAFALSFGNERLVAGTIAALVAWRTRNVSVTLAIGMVALWTIKAMLAR